MRLDCSGKYIRNEPQFAGKSNPQPSRRGQNGVRIGRQTHYGDEYLD